MAARSIIICDDEVELTAELAEFLEAAGWSVRAAFTGPEAAALLAAGPRPDCLLTDLRIADFDGARLIAAARTLPPDRRPGVLAVMTGHLEESSRAADLGADVLYLKPIDPDVVEADLSRLARTLPAGP